MSTRVFIEVPADLRSRVADAIESLIGLLDALDGEADGEDAGDAEPGLGAAHFVDQSLWAAAAPDDREHDAAERGLCDGDALAEFQAQADGLPVSALYGGRRAV
jgi:hypothetical protein